MGIRLSDLLPDEIRKETLAKITPSQDEINLQRRIIDQLTNALKETAEKKSFQYSFIKPQGSTGRKQTQLRGAADIDLFVALNPDDYPNLFTNSETPNRKVIDGIMTNLVANWFEPTVRNLKANKIQRAFSQHPYLSLEIDGIDIDILGCFDVDNEFLSKRGPITAVDRTVHHTEYIANRMTQRKRENARILKSFARSCHAYGDRCAVGRMGLTGVTLEIIVLVESNLEAAFKALHNLDKVPIDPLSRPLDELRKIQAFRDDRVYLIDPTDYNRNMASSFSRRSYTWVQYNIEQLWEKLRKGDNHEIIESLIESEIPDSDLHGWIKDHTTVREYESGEEVHYTILRDKLHRLARRVSSELGRERTGEPRFGKTLTEVYFDDEQYALAVFVEYPKVTKTYDRKGPSIKLEEAARRFREKHSDSVFEKGGYLYIKEDRAWTDFREMFSSIIETNPIKGLELQEETSIVSKQTLNVLKDCILSLEPRLVERITRVKEKNKNS
jgi:tRNA nucleotidyltransferase (CCA-adding enzyme)